MVPGTKEHGELGRATAPSVDEALTILEGQAKDLFPDKDQAAQFATLLKEARLRAATSEGASLLQGADSVTSDDLAALEELVHAVTRVEDAVDAVRHAADVVLDWVGKGGRSLGLD